MNLKVIKTETQTIKNDWGKKDRLEKESQHFCRKCNGYLNSGDIPKEDIAEDNWCICNGFKGKMDNYTYKTKEEKIKKLEEEIAMLQKQKLEVQNKAINKALRGLGLQ